MSDFDMSELMKQMRDRRDAYQAKCAEKFAEHRNDLMAKGVVRVVCEYSGYGDSGGVEQVAYLDENAKPVSRSQIEETLDAEVRNYAESLLPAGFENNEGGQGEVVLDLLSRSYAVNHGWNYTEVHGQQYGGEF